MSSEIHQALYKQPEGQSTDGTPQPQLQIPQATVAYPTPAPAGPAPGFPTSPAGPGPRPQSPYQQGYAPQLVPASVVYNGALVPNPEAPPAPIGSTKIPGYFPEKDYGLLKSAKKGMLGVDRWNDDILMQTFLRLSPFEVDALSDHFSAMTGKALVDFLPEKTKVNSWFYEVIHALALGPIGYDVELAKKATRGAGTNERLLIELVLNRSNSDIEILKKAYTKRWGRSLMEEVKADTSGPVQTMFTMALMAQRPLDLPGQIDFARVEKDMDDLYAHGLGKNTNLDETVFFQVFINRSDAHIAALIDRYSQKYTSLSKAIKSRRNLNAEVQKGLLYIIHGVKSKRNKQEPFGAWRDAKLLRKAMSGAGTDNQALVYRIVRASWDPVRLRAIKEAYLQRNGKTLEESVKGERGVSGQYQAILLELIKRA